MDRLNHPGRGYCPSTRVCVVIVVGGLTVVWLTLWLALQVTQMLGSPQ